MVGKFVGHNGHEYKVEFAGDGVSDNQVTLSEVYITMNAHDRKFVGFKSTSAKVSILTDTPLLELYSEGVRDISVTITDVTAEEVIFFGYVVPFTFEQPFTGMADAVTIDCVDAITATKEVKYKSLRSDDNYGVDEPAEDIVRSIFNLAGIPKKQFRLVVHDNFGDGTASGSVLSEIKVAQAGFLQDEMTALDAMNAICLFFGYTATLVGHTLHLYDEHCLTHASDEYARNTHVGSWVGNLWKRSIGEKMRKYAIHNEDIHSGITLSVEQGYDGIQLKLNGSDTSVLLPDVCDPDNIEKNTDGRGTEKVLLMGSVEGKKYWEYRTPVTSKVMDMGEWSDERGTFIPWKRQEQIEALGADAWRNGAMMITAQHYDVSEVEHDEYSADVLRGQAEQWDLPELATLADVIGYVSFNGGDEKKLLWFRAYDKTKKVAEQNYKRYSHSGGFVEIKFKYFIVNDDNKHYTDPEKNEGERMLYFLQVRIGDSYFNWDYSNTEAPKFTDAPSASIVEWGGELLPTNAGVAYMENKLLIPIMNDKQISVSLEWPESAMFYLGYRGASAGQGHVTFPVNEFEQDNNSHVGFFIEQLELVGYGDDVWEGHLDMKHDFKEEPEEVLEVEVNLTTRKSKQEDNPDKSTGVIGVNARPGIVVGQYFPHGGYCGLPQMESLPLCGIIMEQLKARYGEPHERFQMTLNGTDYRPTDTIVFNDNMYTIEGYEKDLVNSTTTLIIN